MKELNFLNKLKKQGKLGLVEPSEQVRDSYLRKAEDCLKSAKLLHDNNLYENSVSASYYAMYDTLTALLFKIGIKCENHTGSIILLNKLFNKKELYDVILFAKKERIDKQYYVGSKDDYKITENSSVDMLKMSEDFLLNLVLFINNIKNNDIDIYRNKFKGLFKT